MLKSATWPLAQSYMLKCAPGGGDSQKRSSLHKKPALVCNAMRDEMAGDVAAERQLIVIERVLYASSCSCRAAVVSGLALTAPSASTRHPSVHRARSRGASVLRLTHAPAAALHARRSTPKGVSMRSLCSAEKRMHHTPDSRASKTPATPPSAPKTKRRKSRGPSPQPSPPPPHRRPTPPPPKPPPTDAQPHRAALPHRPLHPTRRRPPPGPPLPTRTSLGPETNIPAWGRECRPPQG